MNNRFKELVEQASSGACYDEPGAVTLYNDEIKNFAELIVRECIAQCWTVSEIEHKGDVISECSKRMRKRFGVE